MKFLRAIFIFLLFCVTLSFGQATVPVSGNLNNILGTAQSDAFVRFRLRNFSGNVPRVTATGVAVVTQEDVHSDNTGLITTQLYGNDVISPANTFYTLEFWQSGKMQSAQNYLITVSGSPFNFNTAPPITTTPGPAPFLAILQNPTVNQTINNPQFSLTLTGPLLLQNRINFDNVLFANLGSVLLNNGDEVFCLDCQQQTPCAGGGGGAFAQQVGGVAQCSSGGGGGGPAFAVVTNPLSNATNTIQPTAANITPLTLICASGSSPTTVANSILNAALGNAWNVTCGGNMTVGDGVSGTVTGATIYGALKTLVFSATPQFDLSAASVFQLTLTGNVTSSTLLNMPASSFGDVFTLVLCQDGVGSHTFVPPANFINFATIASTSNSCSIQSFATNGTSAYGIGGGSGGGTGLTGTLTQFHIPEALTTGANPVMQDTVLNQAGALPDIFSPRFEQVRYPDQFVWTQSPSGTLTGGTPATVTLNLCPFGINGSDAITKLYVAGTGTPEVITLTGGGSCSPNVVGTITFTPLNSHSAGWTITTATAGIQEALNDAGFNTPNGAVKLAASPGASNAYLIRGAITPQINNVYIDGSGAVLDCETRDHCINVSSTFQVHLIENIRFATNLQLTASAITNTACATNVATITAANSFVVGDTVDVQNTFQQHYWGPHVVVSATGSLFTYADSGCGGFGTIASAASGGGAALQQAAIEANNQGLIVRGLLFDRPGGFTGWFNNGIVVDNDQKFAFNDSYITGEWHCDVNYCSNAVYAPGPFSTKAAVISLNNVNMSLGCAANGVRNYAGNTLGITDSVIQAFPEFGVLTGALRGGFGPSTLSNVYQEVGNCTNPMYPGTLASEAGLISQGTPLRIAGGEGPVGNLPTFIGAGTGGATQKNYWVVIKDSVLGASRPLAIGKSSPSGAGSITLYIPRVQGTNTITYDILETTGGGFQIAAPFGTANQAVLINQAQCSTTLCTFTDTQAALTSYTVAQAVYMPALNFWPGDIVLANAQDNGVPSVLYTDMYQGTVVAEATEGATSATLNYASVYAKECGVTALGSPILAICQQQDTGTAGSTTSVGANLIRHGVFGGETGGLKGWLNFTTPGGGTIAGSHIITLIDSNPEKTLASPGNNPTWDAADSYIGMDQTSGLAVASQQLAIGSPVSISQYINNVGDGTSWKTRLTNTVFQGQVPFSAPTATNLYVIDGITYTSLCTLVTSTIPINTAAIIWDEILETNVACDPFAQTRNIELHLGRFTSPYTWSVPIRIPTNNILRGSGRGNAGGGAVKGTMIQPSGSYANPFVSTVPSGFTLTTTTSCGGVFPTVGTYMIELTWGPDSTRETTVGQETAVALSGSNCFQITHPSTPPANVTTYDVYACSAPGCASGSEKWVAQQAIGVDKQVSWSGASFPTGSGSPPNQNTTGIFIVVGNLNGAQGSSGSTQANFGSRLEDLSINCNDVTGAVAAGLLTGEEGSVISSVDAQNCPGVSWFTWEGYGNIGVASANSRMENITGNAGSTSNPSVAGLYIDNTTSNRGLNGATFTPQTGATIPCILINNVGAPTPFGGTSIANVHMEKCPDGLSTLSAAVNASNLTCSPTNVAHCVHFDINAKPSTAIGIRGGSSDNPILDDSTGFTAPNGFMGLYSNGTVEQIALEVGLAPTACAFSNIGTTGSPTCTLRGGSNNSVGIMNINTGGGTLAQGTFSLTFSGTAFGINGGYCAFTALNQAGIWNPRVSFIGTAVGTGNFQGLWDNNAVNLTGSTTYAVMYICRPD